MQPPLPKIGSEFDISVRDYCLRQSMQFKNLLHEDFCNVVKLMCGLNRYKMCFLCQIVHHSRDGIMLSPSHWKYCNKIHGNNFTFPFWDRQRLQQPCWVLMLNLYLLTFHAPWNIFSHVLFHSWLKVLLSGCSNCPLISWVTRIWSLMDFIHDNSP